MEHITSRKNSYIRHLRELASSCAYRYETGEYICAGEKLLEEAASAGAEITSVLFAGELRSELGCTDVRSCRPEILEYASPLTSSKGPVFTVRMREAEDTQCKRTIVLDGIQNPGNVGTIIRTCAAFSFGTVILLPGCADKYNPKTVQGAMGALFRCRVIDLDYAGLRSFLDRFSLRLFGADLLPGALDVRGVPREGVAVAIGSEGAGLSGELRNMLDGSFKIPIAGNIESLNAAVAAAVTMWELVR